MDGSGAYPGMIGLMGAEDMVSLGVMQQAIVDAVSQPDLENVAFLRDLVSLDIRAVLGSIRLLEAVQSS